MVCIGLLPEHSPIIGLELWTYPEQNLASGKYFNGVSI